MNEIFDVHIILFNNTQERLFQNYLIIKLNFNSAEILFNNLETERLILL